MKRKLSLITILSICCSILAVGCGKKMKLEDAPVYVQAVLDARYKADYSAYMEYKECTEEEPAQIHEQGMNALLNTIKIGTTSVSTELKDQYRQLFEDFNSLCKYTVGTAEKDGDGFTVEVSAQPFTMFGGISENLVNALQTEEFLALTTDDKINQYLYEQMYDLISPKVSSPEYGSEETITLHIQPNANKIYTISEEDLNALDAMIYASLL